MNRPPLTDEKGEVRALTLKDFRGARPIACGRSVFPFCLLMWEIWSFRYFRPGYQAERTQPHRQGNMPICGRSAPHLWFQFTR
jgi:hypothetical protein